MRDYGKVYSAFWHDNDMRELSDDGRILALYLMTCPHGNMLGCFRLPEGYVADDLRWDVERVRKGFRELFEKGFAYRCDSSFFVFIRNFLKWNQFENPNVATSAKKLFESLPCPDLQKSLLVKALREFAPKFSRPVLDNFEKDAEPFANPFETVSKTRARAGAPTRAGTGAPTAANNAAGAAVVPRVPAPPDRDVVGEIFAYWQKVMQSPRSQLDAKRTKAIKEALKLYEPRQVCEAIAGCARSAWHMGENDRRTKYNGITLILRDAEHIDRFIELASKQQSGPETIEQRNERILRELVAGDSQDPNVIDVEMEEAHA